VDALVEQARRSLNQTEREKLYGEVQDIVAKEMVWIPVYTTKEIVRHARRRQGIPDPPGGIQSDAVEDLDRQVSVVVGGGGC